jgi:hypothetical protein
MDTGGLVSIVRYKLEEPQELATGDNPNHHGRKLFLFDRSPEIPPALTTYTLEMEGGQTLRFCVREIGLFEPTGEIIGN